VVVVLVWCGHLHDVGRYNFVYGDEFCGLRSQVRAWKVAEDLDHLHLRQSHGGQPQRRFPGDREKELERNWGQAQSHHPQQAQCICSITRVAASSFAALNLFGFLKHIGQTFENGEQRDARQPEQ